MIRKLLLIAFLCLLPIEILKADAASEILTESLLSKSHWKFSKVSCPIGCSEHTKTFLKKYVDTELEISPQQFKAPFLDQCSGATRIEIKDTPVSSMLDEINKSSASKRKITALNLGLQAKSISSAIVFCKDEHTEFPIARFISIEPKRLLMLFEEQSIIEFR